MKKILAVVFIGVLSLILVGCGREESAPLDVSDLTTMTCTAVGCVWEDDNCMLPEGSVWTGTECRRE